MKRTEHDMYAEAFRKWTNVIEDNTSITPESYNDYKVKRGLRNSDGTGVLAGLTRIGQVHGYIMYEGEKIPDDGKLTYRGVDVKDIVSACERENRFGYEETCYLLLFGKLPTKTELDDFKSLVGKMRALPNGFREEVIMYSPSNNIMNKLARSVLAMYSYDNDPDSIDLYNLLRQSILLFSQVPTMVAYAYEAKRHYFDKKSLIIHNPQAELSTAQNFLHMIRPDNQYTDLEAKVLDLALILHAEHGGGNNSAFTTRVVSSSNTDTYSAIAAAIGSLKGPRHGGANCKVVEMVENFKQNLTDINDKDQVAAHIETLLDKEAFDRSGLIYGMGHAIYTKSDPRAVMLKEKAEELAYVTGNSKEFKLYSMIEELTPEIFARRRGIRGMCANVDLYSGFVYKCLNIPTELYTPIFAIARMAGWCAHRIEQINYDGKIVRPAYKSVCKNSGYIPMDER
ncbi:MAG: citrate/2-methylcitrate synthase [Clostridia bacterium]|nr:citrate/2-methylcitrate synthase [Clostridia bacterium]